VVEVALRCENQDGSITSPATASVLLPTRDRATLLPTAPAPTQDALLESEIERLAAAASE
jgi:hypothetical protein